MSAGWRPIGTVMDAPKDEFGVIHGVLIAFGNEGIAHCYFDPYYAKDGSGYEGYSGWLIEYCSEPVELHLSHKMTHWMPLPEPPK